MPVGGDVHPQTILISFDRPRTAHFEQLRVNRFGEEMKVHLGNFGSSGKHSNSRGVFFIGGLTTAAVLSNLALGGIAIVDQKNSDENLDEIDDQIFRESSFKVAVSSLTFSFNKIGIPDSKLNEFS